MLRRSKRFFPRNFENGTPNSYPGIAQCNILFSCSLSHTFVQMEMKIFHCAILFSKFWGKSQFLKISRNFCDTFVPGRHLQGQIYSIFKMLQLFRYLELSVEILHGFSSHGDLFISGLFSRILLPIDSIIWGTPT